MLKTYHGSCHCGAVRYEADMDLVQGASKCSCSICAKTRNWGIGVKPNAFRLIMISGADDLSDYQLGSNCVHHLLCRHCGVQPFTRGHVAETGGDFVSIRQATLDDTTPAELIEAPVRYFSGRDNDWWNTPAETRHL
jgi:hypothetical protein